MTVFSLNWSFFLDSSMRFSNKGFRSCVFLSGKSKNGLSIKSVTFFKMCLSKTTMYPFEFFE